MSSRKAAARSALARLKAKREGGGGGGGGGATSSKVSDGSDSDRVYDEVSEDEYASAVRGRMMEDDFIEDDDGGGYMDDGRDVFENEEGGAYESDTEDEAEYYERTGRRKPKKGTKAAAAANAAAKKTSVASAYTNQAASARKKPARPTLGARSAFLGDSSSSRPAMRTTEKEEDFMQRLIGGLQPGNEPPTPSPASRVSLAPPQQPHHQARKRPRGDFSAFRPSSAARESSPSSGAPSSDPPELADLMPGAHVHISGSDSPPWDTAANEDQEHHGLPAHKRPKSTKATAGLPQSVNAISLHVQAAPAMMDVDGDAEDEDDDDGFSIRTNKAGARAPIVNVAAKRALATPPSRPVAPHVAHLDEPQPPSTPHTSWQNVGAKLSKVTSAPAPETPAPSRPAVAARGKSSAAVPSTPATPASTKTINAFESDGRSVRFYWLDWVEQQGSVFLTGKVKNRDTGKCVSATLDVQGVERCVYLLPKVKLDGTRCDEDEVYDEFDNMRSKYGIKNFLAKWVTRKYAFEVPGVPVETEYLKIKYGFDEPELPADISGATFSRAFGTATNAFELFVVKRGIMGPCWLNVRDAQIRTDGPELSWTKIEFQVDEPKSVSPFKDDDETAPREAPPVTVMSLAGRTVMNHEANKREVVCVSAQTWRDMQLEDPTPPEELESNLFTVVRPLGERFPNGFEAEAKAGRTRIMAVKYERMLLNQLLAQIHLQDPDIIVSHEFSGVFLDVLLKRIAELKADHWSRIGRFRKARMPTIRAGYKLALVAGRLVCDLASETAKGIIPSVTWSLTEMCATHLKTQREDVDPDETAAFFDSLAPSPARLLTFVRHCEVDAFLQMALACKVQILALTKQLTNLAGNSWARCLNGGRAERNDYILLHDFHRHKYICPDKPAFSSSWEKKKAAAKADHDGAAGEGEEEANAGKVASKQQKFKGGLVFEPKRGLYDKYILVMDFNSLYPSIIQEYNIDFTTVDRAACNANLADVDQLPELPSSDVAQGVLPRLIATLVARRRGVKSLMKDTRASPAQQLQWNIKQLALKLTANSMYGCLGFDMSRFYARPLAALTTFKGREVLMATKELAESLSLDVIYGDTDSVMINTNATDLAQAMRIGAEFRKKVNERYRLLEIDIDGVFQRMLLVQKKKYAAIKVEDNGAKTSTEVKGLDQKRREYCALAKNVSNYVLEQILSGEATETVVAKIHEYLCQIGDEVRESKIDLEDYIIYKQLGKNPSEYNPSVALPHVKVALRAIEKGESARAGDVIPYVFCLGEDGSSASKSAQADRAFSPNDLRRQGSTLKIDFEHYLALQLLPPIERLCENIEGTDRMRLAECLGLDASRYASHTTSAAESGAGREFSTLDSQVPDEVKFASCEALRFKCSSCGQHSTFEGLMACNGMLQRTGIACTHESCCAPFGLASLAIQLEQQIRQYIARFYEGWSVCTEPTCGAVTRLAGVYARRCLVSGCRGKTELRYSDKALYTQLCFLSSLFDADRCRENSKGRANHADVVACSTVSAKQLAHLYSIVDKYLQRSGRRFVGLEKLFRSLYVRSS
ncbi:dna polymerase alpha catalytic subunit [Ceraceosorus bombacis]|uniref:DNA polymerase n=1 Tax=Ceraceosorus bombacis TaxID=401625 RepID=A0A0P1BMF1_9BASI|nr:dna polymerase alpha catalytic subunit [Ceraceosorus bombacis]